MSTTDEPSFCRGPKQNTTCWMWLSPIAAYLRGKVCACERLHGKDLSAKTYASLNRIGTCGMAMYFLLDPVIMFGLGLLSFSGAMLASMASSTMLVAI